MGRAFEYRKARKLKRWGNMARTFTKIGKEISIAVKAGGPDPVISIKPEDRWERPVVFLSCSITNVCFISNPKRVSRWRISNLK